MSELQLQEIEAPPRRPRRRRRQASRMQERNVRRLIDAFRTYCDKFDNPQFIQQYVYALEQKLDFDNPHYFDFIKTLKQPPVSIEAFLDSEEFMGATDLVIWPEVRKAIIESNQDWFLNKQGGGYTQFLGAGATGTGKSEIAKASAAYSLHIMGCMHKPQKYWGIPSATQMVYPIFAAKPKVTKNVLYEPLRAYVATMPWFIKNMRFDKYIESEMVFEEQNLRVAPIGADIDSILGEAVFGAIIDEVNFMQIVQNSKKAEMKGGRSGVYDQATDIYNKTTRRKAGRFTKQGPNVGVISTLSSTLYPGEFTERLEKQIYDERLKHIYVYNKAQYECKPTDDYDGTTFRVCVYDDAAGSIQILDEEEKDPKFCTIYDVPTFYKNDFTNDPEGSTRDIIGRSVRPLAPFIKRIQPLNDAFDLGKMADMPNIVNQMILDLGIDGMPEVVTGHYCKNPSRPRYVHIDLAQNRDSCGIGMVRFDGMAEITRKGGMVERLPTCTVELCIGITPDKLDEIDLAEVRSWVQRLKTDVGYPIRVVSFDGWNSLESRQQLKKAGMPTALISVDKAPCAAYKQFRDGIYDGRIALPDCPELYDEIKDLQYDDKKDKVDHTPTGSKDIADGVAGAYYLMLQRSATWRTSDDGGRILHEGGRFESDRMDTGDRR